MFFNITITITIIIIITIIITITITITITIIIIITTITITITSTTTGTTITTSSSTTTTVFFKKNCPAGKTQNPPWTILAIRKQKQFLQSRCKIGLSQNIYLIMSHETNRFAQFSIKLRIEDDHSEPHRAETSEW